MEGTPQNRPEERREEGGVIPESVNDAQFEEPVDTLGKLKERLASLREVLKKDVEHITDKERADVKKILPLAAKIRALEVEAKKKLN